MLSDRNKQALKEIGGYLPVITIVYFGFAYLYMIVFYRTFNIDPVDYYDYNEILFPLASPLLLIALCLIAAVANQVIQHSFFETVTEIPVNEKLNWLSKAGQFLWKIIRLLRMLLKLIALCFALYLSIRAGAVILGSILIVLLVIATFIPKNHPEIKNPRKVRNLVFLLCLCMCFFVRAIQLCIVP